MRFGSFKNRISQAVSAVEASTETVSSGIADVVTTAEQTTQDTITRTWADKVSLASGPADKPAGMLGQLTTGTADTTAPVKITVQVGGQELDAKKVFIASIQTRHAVNEIPTATVILNVPQSAPEDYTELDNVLTRCKVGQQAILKVDKQKAFEGVVGALQVTAGESGFRISLRLKHRLQGLKATSHSRVWKPQQDAVLVRQILSEHKVHTGTVTLSEGEPVQRLQWNCTDWQFVRALLGLHGAWLWPQADGSVRVQAPQMAGKTHRITARPTAGGTVVLGAEWGFSGMQQPSGAAVQSWDLSKQAVVKKTAKTRTMGSGGLTPAKVAALGTQSEALVTGHWDGVIQQATADGWLAAQHAQAVRVRLTLSGCHVYQPGDTVLLEGFGSHLNGQGLITWVEYQCDVNGRMGRTVVGVGLDEDTAAAPVLPVPSGLVTGTVAAFKADPKGKWNRLSVKIPVLGADVLWARMGHLYATKDSGVTFYPEEGDEVALAFVGSEPVIVASLHNPTRAAAFEPSAKNARKGMVLRHAGKRAEWSFDRDKHTVTLELGDDKKPEQHIALDQAKGVLVTSLKGNVRFDVKEGEAAWTTKKNIALKADEQITVTGKTGIKVSSDKDVALEAKARLSGQGKTSVEMTSEQGKLQLTPEKANLSAAKTTVTGEMTVDINGNESVNIKGAKVDVKGEAEATVSALKVAVKGQAEASVQADVEVKIAGNMTEVGGAGITNVKGSLVNLG